MARDAGPPGELRVHVLGPIRVDGVPVRNLGSRKARTLLTVLALARGQPVATDRLADVLWGDEPPAEPADQLSVLVSRLRGAVGRDRLPREGAGYRLAVDWLDVSAAEDLAAEARRRLDAGQPASAGAAANAGLALVRGAPADDELDPTWAEADRAASRRLAQSLHRLLAGAALAGGELTRAAEAAEAAIGADRYDEEALRLLMCAHALAGRPGSALAAYAEARARLAEDLGSDVAPETEALHTAIVRSEPLPAGAGPRPPTIAVGARELPGRADALAGLDAAMERASAGRPELVLVEGEAGIGKTALLDAWSPRAGAAGATVLRGRCAGLERDLPLQGVLDAVRDHLESAGAERAHALLGEDSHVLAPLVGSAALAGEPERASARSLVDGPVGPSALFRALLGVLGRVAASAPTVVLLDDAHLAGASTLEWLRFAVDAGAGRRLLLVAAARIEERPALAADATIVLGPLDLTATAEVVGDERAVELHRRSGGLPLFLVELAAARPDEELPASVRDAVVARAERSGAAAGTLQTAAVLGPDIDLDLLAAVMHRPPVEVLDHLEEGARRRLVAEDGSRFVFAHDLVRVALTTGTTAARAALVHREAGRVLAGRGRRDPVEVAYHARLGGDDVLAAGALAEAAELAADRFDYAEAERLLDRALTLADDGGRRLARGRVRTLRGDYGAAVADAEHALALDGGAAALEVAGWATYFARDMAGAQAFADDGAALATEDTTRARCLILAGRTRHAAGDLRGAEDRFVEATRLARGADLAVASVWLGVLRSHQSRTAEALALLRSGTRPGATPGRVVALLHGLMFSGHAHALAGQVVPALAAFDAYQAEVERAQVPRFAGRGDNFTGWVLRNLGAVEEADASNLVALEHKTIAETEVAAHLDLAEGGLNAGDLDGARRHLEVAEDGLGREMVFGWRQRLKARLHRARLELVSARPVEALEIAGALATDAQALGIPRYAIPARLLAARARAALGEPVDLDAVGADLAALPDAVAIEAWWITLDVADALGVDAWRTRAEEQFGALVRQAGDHADTLEGFARRRFP